MESKSPSQRSDGSQRIKQVSGAERVEDVRWWGAASVTTGAEHPLIFPLTATGVWGYPPDKQLNAVNQPTSFGNVVGKQGTGGKETRILAAAPVAPHPILLQKIMTCDS